VRSLTRGERLIVATHNPGKLREFAGLFLPFGIATVAAGDLGLPEPAETGSTFVENALIKATAAAKGAGLPALADDSGVAVDALGGAPGVRSADWAGPEKDFGKAMRRVEDDLRAVGATSPAERTARFIAVLCLAFPDGSHASWLGEIDGTVVWPPRGTGGFGYDPMFVPDGYSETFGELPAEVKQELSHRAAAFRRFAAERLPR
jgi:XTP/dITP diphosphohydrolase